VRQGAGFTTISPSCSTNKKVGFSPPRPPTALPVGAGGPRPPADWHLPDVQPTRRHFQGEGQHRFGLTRLGGGPCAESLPVDASQRLQLPRQQRKVDDNSAPNIETFRFPQQLVASEHRADPARKPDRPVEAVRQGQIGMINARPLIPIIQDGKVLTDSTWPHWRVLGQGGSAATTLGVWRLHGGVQEW